MYEKILPLHRKWLEAQPLPQENSEALWLCIRLRFNYKSNAFEGNGMTYSGTQKLLIHGRVKGDYKMRDIEEMKAHNVAFNYILKLAKEDRLISETDIRSLNKIILKEPFYKIAQTLEGEPTKKN